jgi:hypothetical protein
MPMMAAAASKAQDAAIPRGSEHASGAPII